MEKQNNSPLSNVNIKRLWRYSSEDRELQMRIRLRAAHSMAVLWEWIARACEKWPDYNGILAREIKAIHR